jgi:MFS family permease
LSDPRPVAVGDGHDEYARRHFLRNAGMLTLENAGFLAAIAFVGSNTVLPTFITRLGGSAFLVGLIATCQSAGWLLPQMVGARICAGKPRIMRYLLVPIMIGRPVYLVVAALTVLLGTGFPAVLLAALYTAILVFFGTDGLASVPWFELVAKTIPPDRRGRMFGMAQIGGGLAGMGVGALVAVILKSPGLPFPSNYALLFALSSGLFLLNIMPFLFMKEPVHQGEAARSAPAAVGAATVKPASFLSSLVQTMRQDRNFVRLIVVRLLLGTAMAVFPFYILFMDRVGSISAEKLGLFTSAQVFGGLAGGLIIGWIADHLGTRTVIRASAVTGAAVPGIGLLMILLGTVPSEALLAPGVLLFVLMGFVSSTNLIGFMNYLMETAPRDRRAQYIGMFNTVAGVLMVVPPMAGWLLSSVSFGPLFALAVASSLGGFVVSLGLRKPVRTSREG